MFFRADINSDHNPVVMNFSMHRFVKQEKILLKKIDVVKLQHKYFESKVAKAIMDRFREMEPDKTIDYEEIKNVIADIQESNM